MFIIKDPVTLRYFRLREPEYFVARQLDGRTSGVEIQQRLRAHFGIDLSAATIESFIGELEKVGFTESGLSEYQIATAKYRGFGERKKTLFQKILFIKLKAFDPDRFLEQLASNFGFLYSRGFLGFSLILLGLALNILLTHKASFAGLHLGDLFRVGGILFAFFTIFIVVSLHELAHGVTCKRYGGRVHEMGFLLLYFQPCLYTNLSDAWLFTKKRQRLGVTFVGAYFQLVIWAVATIIWNVTEPDSFLNRFSFVASAVTFISILFNFNPLIKLDGYYLLSDWLEIPNLRQKAFQYLRGVMGSFFLGVANRTNDVAISEKRVYFLYGILAVVYSSFLIGWVLYKLAQFFTASFEGFGFVLFSLVLLGILGRPMVDLARDTAEFIEKEKTVLVRSRRLWINLGIAGVMGLLLIFVKYDLRVARDCQIEASEIYRITSQSTGFMEENLFREGQAEKRATDILRLIGSDFAMANFLPRVREGQKVKAGDTVANIISNLYQNELTKAQANYRKAKAIYELLLQGPKPAEIQKERENVAQLKIKLQQKENDFSKAQQLFEKKLISQQEYDNARDDLGIARTDLGMAEKQLEILTTPPREVEIVAARSEIEQYQGRINTALKQLEKTTFKSPISGTVLTVRDKGELLSIANLDSMRVLIPASEKDLDIIAVEQPMRAKLKGFPDLEINGRVFKINRQSEEYKSKVIFIVTGIVQNPGHVLRPGMTGKAKIYCGKVPIYQLIWRGIRRFLKVEFWSWW